jgi:hypothetical protein
MCLSRTLNEALSDVRNEGEEDERCRVRSSLLYGGGGVLSEDGLIVGFLNADR